MSMAKALTSINDFKLKSLNINKETRNVYYITIKGFAKFDFNIL